MVQPLPQKLHRGDGPALVLLREVQVVDEDDALLTHGGAVDTLPPSVQLGHDHIWADITVIIRLLMVSGFVIGTIDNIDLSVQYLHSRVIIFLPRIFLFNISSHYSEASDHIFLSFSSLHNLTKNQELKIPTKVPSLQMIMIIPACLPQIFYTTVSYFVMLLLFRIQISLLCSLLRLRGVIKQMREGLEFHFKNQKPETLHDSKELHLSTGCP